MCHLQEKDFSGSSKVVKPHILPHTMLCSIFESIYFTQCVCPCSQSLKWLDLKDNPLEASLAKAAGDCLDEKQCKQCATKVRDTEKMTENR